MTETSTDRYWSDLSGPVRTVAAAIGILNRNGIPVTVDAIKERCRYSGVDVERVLRDLVAAGHVAVSSDGLFTITHPPLVAAVAAHS